MEVLWLIREAFLRGLSTRAVGDGGADHGGGGECATRLAADARLGTGRRRTARPSPGGGRDAYPQLVTRLLRDLPELLAFFQCPRSLGRKLQTTRVIERCFVEVRRRTRPMGCL